MKIVVAALDPDVDVGVGTPRELAFTQAFVDEEYTFVVMGALYGYPPNLSNALDRAPGRAC